MYYWAHRAMHIRQFYALVHKHHHRQIMPERGYSDAANESPIEQIIGLAIVWLSLSFVSKTVGIHLITGCVFFPIFGIGAILNHTPYDINLSPIFCLGYSIRSHETHHRIAIGNYGQHTMFWDKVFGTFQEYREGLSKNS